MLTLVSSLGAQSSIARRTALFSTLAVPLVGIWGILLPMELKISGFARCSHSHHGVSYNFSFIGWFQSNKRQFWRLQRALGYFQSRGVSIHLAILFSLITTLKAIHHISSFSFQGGNQLWQQSWRVPCGQPMFRRHFLLPGVYDGGWAENWAKILQNY